MEKMELTGVAEEATGSTIFEVFKRAFNCGLIYGAIISVAISSVLCGIVCGGYLIVKGIKNHKKTSND